MNRVVSVVLALCLLACSGCSSFDRDWRAAAQRPGHRVDRMSGAWDGKWTSERHRLPDGQAAGGRLRCIFTKEDATHYRARFHANWLCFATGYETTFETKQRGDGLDFRGTHDLGAIFGGVYRYEGRVTPDRFVAHFASRFDSGAFDLHRPGESPSR